MYDPGPDSHGSGLSVLPREFSAHTTPPPALVPSMGRTSAPRSGRSRASSRRMMADFEAPTTLETDRSNVDVDGDGKGKGTAAKLEPVKLE